LSDRPVAVGTGYPSLLSLPALLAESESGRDEILDMVLEFLVRDTGAARGTVFLVDLPRAELVSVATRGREVEGISIALGEGLAGRAASTGETQRVAEAYGSPLFDRRVDELTGFRTESVLAVPVGRSPARAVLQVLNKPGGFTPSDAAFLQEVARQLEPYFATS